MKNSVLALLIIACVLEGGEGRLDKGGKALKVRLEIPRFPKAGDPVILGCKYDLGSDLLYTVKWYKGSGEFYRYTPKESPSVKIFPELFPGLDVDLVHSNATQLALRRVDLSMSGKYSCEVTTDAPEFLTDLQTALLTVVAFPISKPVISQLKNRYSVGDVIDVNCSSYRSRPPANLTWFINSTPAPLTSSGLEKVKERDGSETSRLHLRLKLQPTHFIHSRLVLKCTATIFDRYLQSSEFSIDEDDRPKISSVVDNSSSQSSSSNDNNRLRNSGSSQNVGRLPIRFELIKIGAFFSIQIQCQLIYFLIR